MRVTKPPVSRSFWKVAPQRVIVPYATAVWTLEEYLSRSGHVEPRLNLRGPSRKAKYSPTTDSELSRATERWEEPLLGEVLNLKPCAYKRSEHYASLLECVTACLLHNDPASYRLRLG